MLKKLLFTLLAASALQAGAKGPLHIDLSDGSATITPETVTLGDGSTQPTSSYTNFVITSSGETSNGLTITGGTETSPIEIVLDHVNINRSNINDGNHTLSCPVYIESGYVNMILSGESTLRGGVNNPGICVPDGATLTITELYGLDAGILHACGGSEVAGGGGGAGIGGEVYGTCGTLILNSGTVYAKGCKGGAGFGSGWQWEPSSTLAGGKFIQNGGEAHFTGSSAGYGNSYLRGSCFEGVGSVNAATTVQLNGGTFYSTVRTNSTVTLKGQSASAHTFTGLSPNTTYTLYNHFGTPETTVTTDQYGNFIYWLTDNQEVGELIGDRCTVKVATNPAGNGTVTGAGFYNVGEQVEFKYTPKSSSVYDFDNWNNGAIDNPTTITVNGDMTVVANVSPKLSKMWHASPLDGSETECYVYTFDGARFTGDVLELPETFELNGKTYTTTTMGSPMDLRFQLWSPITISALTFPSGLTQIVHCAFYNMNGLNTIVVNAATPPALMGGNTSFYPMPSDCTLKVPYGTSAAYAAAPGWKDFATIEELPNPVPTLDVAQGSVSITPEGYTVGGTFVANPTRRYVLTSSAETANTVTIAGGTEDAPLGITLDNLNINRGNINDKAPAGGAFFVNSGYVNLTLSGESTLRSGKDMAGLNMPAGTTVVIDGDGTLRSYGGSYSAGDGGGAGIGARSGGSCGTLILNSGTVYAQGCKGGAGFGSGWEYTTHGGAGGTFIQNGGEAHFRGSVGNGSSSCPDGVGSVNRASTVELNDGIFDSTIRSNTSVTVDGVTATAHTFTAMTPGATYMLYNLLGMEEATVTADSNGNFGYWLVGDQTINDLIGDRRTVKVAVEPAGNGSVSGAGFYPAGTQVEFEYTPKFSSVYELASWSNGATDNPTTITVSEDMTVTANVSPSVKRMWHASPIQGSETECYVIQFDGARFTDDVLELPETFELNGKTYTTTTMGSPDDHMFYMWSPITISQLTLPSGLKQILHCAFYNMNGLKTIVVNAATPPALMGGNSSFYPVPSGCTLKVPYGSAEAYRTAPGWSAFADNIEELPQTIDVAQGSVSITPEGYTIGGVFTAFGGRYVLTSSAETANGVTISGGTEDSPLDITLDNLNINRSSISTDRPAGGAFIVNSGYVNLTLAGESTLRSGKDMAGLNIPDGATVVIDGDGTIRSYGGSDVAGNGGGAGIGANFDGSCGTLIINGGTVYAQGWKGGAGFGSGWQYTTDGSKSGGTFIQNGGEAHLRGSSTLWQSSCPDGIGSVNGATTVALNGGIFDATIRTNTSVTVDGVAAKPYSQSGMTPGATYTLTGLLCQTEATVTADSNGNLPYWLVGDQTFKELIGNRCIVSATVSKTYQGSVTGAGFYEVGEQVELKFVRASGSIYDFDDWSNGSTDNPTTITVSEDMTITANVSPRVDLMWRSRPVDGSETECYVDGFEGMEFTGTTLSLPESFEIDGKTYTTVSLGEPQDGMFDAMMHGEISELILPATLTQISSRTFGMLYLNNATVTVNAKTPPALIRDAEAFDYIPDGCTLKVPKGSAEAYKAAPGWKDFTTLEEMPELTATLDLAENAITITPEGYTIDGTFTAFEGRYVITTSATTANTLTVDGGTEEAPLRLTFDGVDIDNSACTADMPAGGAIIVNSGNIDLTLAGESTLRGGKEMAGLNIPDGATVAISGDGTLRSFGGGDAAKGYGGAGIGANAGGTCGKLIINGANVYGRGAQGGAGFGSGAGYGYIGTKPGGRLVMNGGEATFEGSQADTATWSITQGVGSTNGTNYVELNGGKLNSSFYNRTEITYQGQPTTHYLLRGLTPNTTYVLYNMLGMPEYKETSSTNRDEVFISYWLTDGQTLKDLIGDRALVQAQTQYGSDNGIVYGGGIYEKGTEVEFRYERNTSNSNVNDFDHWSNGSTDMPMRFTVEEDMTLTAYLEPRVEYMWQVAAIDGTDNECYVSEFNGRSFTGTVLEVPASFEIDGEKHTTTAYGHHETGSFLFETRNSISELILPETLTKIGRYCLDLRSRYAMPDEEPERYIVTCHAVNPPAVIGGDSFPYLDFNKYTLKVPKGSAEAYKAAPGWKDFYTVDEMDTTGLGDVDAANNEAPVYYDLRGVMVGSDIRTLVPGLYIERRGTSVKRILVDR